MLQLNNQTFTLQLSEKGTVEGLYMQKDEARMNWVVAPEYLEECGYADEDKCFGQFTLTANGRSYDSLEFYPEIITDSPQHVTVRYLFPEVSLELDYLLGDEEGLKWSITVHNENETSVKLQTLRIWFSMAYVMFRDKNVRKNIEQSCAVFPHLSTDFSKFACIRRSNAGPHLGVYNTSGRTVSLASFCRYENKFLEKVSPSLDGIIFQSLCLVDDGREHDESVNRDWIYGEGFGEVIVPGKGHMDWAYQFSPLDCAEEFHKHAYEQGHPWFEYAPVLTKEGLFHATLRLPLGESLQASSIKSFDYKEVKQDDVLNDWRQMEDGSYKLEKWMNSPGEHKLEVVLTSGKTDFTVWNVLESMDCMLEARAQYVCDHCFVEEEGHERRYAFLPLSNQGEALGKLGFILQKNLIAAPVAEQIHKVEMSAVRDMKHHWFVNGDFLQPRKLYGEFYRIFDLDYAAHVYYLLSKFQPAQLFIHSPVTYLHWAAEVMIVRLDEQLHESVREKKETGMNSIFIMYITDLIDDLKRFGLTELNVRLSFLWKSFNRRIAEESEGFNGAVTEHFYDNAGFGPACEALCRAGRLEEAARYGELLLANIGFSNDYRAQNPDRWWEAQAYMIHSLWGGLVAGSTLAAYEHLRKPEYLLAAYRSMMAVFTCYDWNMQSSVKKLEKGQGASTYCVSSPNLNLPQLSRNRFGQSAFLSMEDELFSNLFSNSTGDDWDMGEELVAYLNGFGTKTYLYYHKDEICCVNGHIVRDGDRYIITSYAAYPRAYYFYEENLSITSDSEDIIREVVLENGVFRRADL